MPLQDQTTGMRVRFDHRAALGVILVIALLVRVLPLTYTHFWDETVYLQDAKVIADGRTNYDEFFERPPVLSIVYAAGFSLWDNIYVANIMQGLFTTLAVLVAFAYVRRSFGVAAGVCAAFLLAFAPYFVETSHELMSDMPAVTLMLAAMWLFDKGAARYALLAGVAYALAVETRFTCLFLALYFLLEVAWAPRTFRRLVLLGIGAAATLAPYLVWLKVRYGSFFYPFELARRIVHEWTAPVPASFYLEGVWGILPPSLWAAIALAVVLLVRSGFAHGGAGGREARGDESTQQLRHQLTLLLWGGAFFAYMLSIPHKEIRYLLPLAIPAVVLGGVGIASLWQWLARQPTPLRTAGLLLGALVAILDYGRPVRALAAGPLVDRSESPEVQIGLYLRDHSTPADTIYAAHNFPVLAFYSGRRTVSLLPIQQDFARQECELMSKPGYFVYFLPEHIGEIHARDPRLKPDRAFLAAHSNFTPVQEFSTATVYRYAPHCGASLAQTRTTARR